MYKTDWLRADRTMFLCVVASCLQIVAHSVALARLLVLQLFASAAGGLQTADTIGHGQTHHMVQGLHTWCELHAR